MRRRDFRALLWTLALGAALALPTLVFAYVPRAERVADAAAGANRSAARTRALRLEISLRIEDGDPVARGELVTHPTGLARLELRGAGDLVERHLLQGSDHLAARNGRPLDNPRAFLPPLFLLQAESGVTLRAALSTFGAEVNAIGLAPCGTSDCYVVGDARPAAAPGGDRPGSFPRLWVDLESYEIVGVDSPAGVKVRFGPLVQFEGVRFPRWFRIEEPDRRPVRFEVLGATPVSAPASAFGNSWLFDTSSETAPSPGAAAPGASPATGADF